MSFFPKHGRFSSINVGTIQTKFINSDAITNSITIDDISPTTTKGDILVDDGTNVIRFPIGTASQILSTDLTETSGLKWIAAPSGGGSFTASSTDTLTNKTFDIDGTGNVFSNIANTNVKSGANIDAIKLGTGLITNTEFNYLNGITSTVVGISTSQTLTNKIISSGTNTIGANELRTTGSSVVIDTASPPTTGQVLKATSATTATWQTPSSGGGAGTVVYVNGGTFTISTEPHNTTFLLDSNVAITLPSLTGIDGFIYNFVSATLEIAPTWTITTSDGILYSSITEVGNETGNATTLTASSSNNVSYRTVTLMALNTTFQWVCIGTAFGWSGSGGGGGGGG